MEVFIEVSKGSNIKYEHDKEKGQLVLDRILHNTHKFPYNYGYIPNTLSKDGDPLDVIVLNDNSIIPGCVVKCKVIGGIFVSDEEGIDDKIICVVDDKKDPKSKFINKIADINQGELNNIIYFLKRYKDGEKDKFINVGETYDIERAYEVINESIEAFNS